MLQGHGEIVEMLLDTNENAGVNVDRCEGSFGNALQAAAYQGHAKIIDLLLVRRPDVNAKGGIFENALQAACAAGHLEIASKLLVVGAEANALGGILGSPLQAALAGGHDGVVLELKKHGARYASGGRNQWKQAYSKLQSKQGMNVIFEKGLSSPPKLPSSLSPEQRLLAAVVQRSPQSFAEKLIKSTEGRQRDRSEKLAARVIALDPHTKALEQDDYIYQRLFWAGLHCVFVSQCVSFITVASLI